MYPCDQPALAPTLGSRSRPAVAHTANSAGGPLRVRRSPPTIDPHPGAPQLGRSAHPWVPTTTPRRAVPCTPASALHTRKTDPSPPPSRECSPTRHTPHHRLLRADRSLPTFVRGDPSPAARI